MSCLSALPNQITTFLSVPHEVLLLRHRVFREYAKIAIGPDFIHTFPSLIVFAAMCVALWKKCPNFRWLPIATDSSTIHKTIQICCSWIVINGALWLWLVFQRVIYCTIWSHRKTDLEHREVPPTWWQTVWVTFYPPPLEPPAMSADFISWIVSMLLAVGILGCALSINRVGKIVDGSSRKVQEILEACNSRYDSMSKKLLENVFTMEKIGESEDNSEVSSMCDDRRSELSAAALEAREVCQRLDIHPISYGTNWTPRPSFGTNCETAKMTKRKSNIQSLKAANSEANEPEIVASFSPRLLRNRRGCHTVIPSYQSDKPCGC